MRKLNKSRKVFKVAMVALMSFYVGVSGIYMGVAMDDFIRRYMEPRPCASATHAYALPRDAR